MNVQAIVVGPFAVNCYVFSTPSRRALVIDPGSDANRIATLLRQEHLEVAAYAITHGHMDHISALKALSMEFPAPVAMHARDAEWAFHPSNAMPPYYEAPAMPPSPLRPLHDRQVMTDLGLDCHVLETPGHSPGGVCFYFPGEGLLFTGDTLFAGSVGRTDLEGGDEALLATSLQRLASLPGDTMVLPGHGPRSTISREIQTNRFLQSR